MKKSLFASLSAFRNHKATAARRISSSRPVLEHLEERLAPAGNILASVYPYPQEAFREYTPTGSQVRSVTIPPPVGSSADEPRDLVADANGKVYVYNGTFNPTLSIYNPTSQTW